MARDVDRPDCWERLAQQALKQGNHKVTVHSRHRVSIFANIVAPDRREGLPADEELRSPVVLVPRYR